MGPEIQSTECVVLLTADTSLFELVIVFIKPIFAAVSIIVITRYTKGPFTQWAPLKLYKMFGGKHGKIHSPTRKLLTIAYAVTVGAACTWYFIDNFSPFCQLSTGQWRTSIVISVPAAIAIFIEYYRKKDWEGVFGGVAQWLSKGDIDLNAEEEAINQLISSASEDVTQEDIDNAVTKIRAMSALGVDVSKIEPKKKSK